MVTWPWARMLNSGDFIHHSYLLGQEPPGMSLRLRPSLSASQWFIFSKSVYFKLQLSQWHVCLCMRFILAWWPWHQLLVVGYDENVVCFDRNLMTFVRPQKLSWCGNGSSCPVRWGLWYRITAPSAIFRFLSHKCKLKGHLTQSMVPVWLS